MRISDSFFALPFVKIRVYGLISPRFCGMGSGHWVATIASITHPFGVLSHELAAVLVLLILLGGGDAPFQIWFLRKNSPLPPCCQRSVPKPFCSFKSKKASIDRLIFLSCAANRMTILFDLFIYMFWISILSSPFFHGFVLQYFVSVFLWSFFHGFILLHFVSVFFYGAPYFVFNFFKFYGGHIHIMASWEENGFV
jgi:hypothetical protein